MENRESGVNPERYRHCERGGCVHDENQPQIISEGRMQPMKRESGDLLERVIMGVLRVTGRLVLFCAHKYGCGSFHTAAVFLFARWDIP